MLPSLPVQTALKADHADRERLGGRDKAAIGETGSPNQYYWPLPPWESLSSPT